MIWNLVHGQILKLRHSKFTICLYSSSTGKFTVKWHGRFMNDALTLLKDKYSICPSQGWNYTYLWNMEEAKRLGENLYRYLNAKNMVIG